MTLLTFAVILDETARKQFLGLDRSIQERIAKKLKQLERDDLRSRHFEHGIPVFVEEVGQYRIAFKTREDLKEKRVVYIGRHKDYEKWYKPGK